jgi:hypothetical protein
MCDNPYLLLGLPPESARQELEKSLNAIKGSDEVLGSMGEAIERRLKEIGCNNAQEARAVAGIRLGEYRKLIARDFHRISFDRLFEIAFQLGATIKVDVHFR